MADSENHDGVFPNLVIDEIRPHDESEDARHRNLLGDPAHFREAA
jgi:hypothetical protein